jgi:hypothetical protein
LLYAAGFTEGCYYSTEYSMLQVMMSWLEPLKDSFRKDMGEICLRGLFCLSYHGYAHTHMELTTNPESKRQPDC